MKKLAAVFLAGAAASMAHAQHTPPRPAPLAFEGDRVIVRFKVDATVTRAYALSAAATHRNTLAARANTIGARHGLALQSGIGISDRSQVMRVDGMRASALVALLASDPDIEAVEPDRRVRRTAVPNDTLFNSGGSAGPAVGQWYLRSPAGSVVSSIDAVTAWDRTMGSASVVVAVVDTGITSHPDLSSKVLPGYDFISDGDIRNKGTLGANLAPIPDASDPGDWVTDAEVNQVGGTFYHCTSPDSQGRYFGENSSWHGTQVAGIAGAATNNGQGMAGTGWDVRVLPVRALGKCFGNTSDIIAGMRWAAGLAVPGVPTNPNPAKVINLSLGSDSPCSSEESRAVADINAVGAVVVAAAGNSTGHAAGSPASCPGVIGVAAIRHVGSKVGFSDVGSALSIAAPGGNCVNLSGACLYPILTTINTGTQGPGAASYSNSSNVSVGTSFSSPLVAATAALMLSAEPSLTPAAVRSAIRSTARPFPQSGLVESNNAPLQACRAPDGTDQLECYCTNTTCGAGMLDAGAAVSAVLGLRPLFTVTPAAPQAAQAITFDSSGSTVASGRTIAARMWTLVSGGGIATAFSGATDGVIASLTPSAAGTLTVRLTITDDRGVAVGSQQSVVVAAAPAPPPTSAGGGGGVMSWPWLLALWLAVIGLARSPSRRR